ncbi:MAG: DUF748 domain-containing protein, partial [Phycisphaerales bacterium]|nr:DUF748 domain-containing protein [Phycisphaerales bacterium]
MTPEPSRSTSAAATTRSPRRGRRWLRRLLIATPIAVALYTVLGFFGVPWLVRAVIVPRIGERLNGSISLERAAFNPFTFRIELERLEVRDDQGERVAALGAFDGNFEAWRSLVQTSWQFQSVQVTKPFLLAAVNADGTLNLARLVKPSKEPATPLREIPRVVIDGMNVDDGEISVRDSSLPEPFGLDFAGLTFDLTNLDTRPGNPNKASLRARTRNGAELEWDGFVESTPFASQGKVVARNVDLAPFMPYGLLYTSGRVVEGRLSFEAEYELAPVAEPPAATATLVSADIVGLKAEHEDQPLLEAPTIHLADAAVDFLARTLSVASYEQAGGSLAVDRDADGTLAFVRILVSPAPRDTGSDAAPQADESVDPRTIQYPVQQFAAALRNLVRDAAGAWTVSIDRAAVSEHQLRLHDRSTPRPVETTVLVKAAEAGPILSTQGYAIPYRATIEPDGGGSVESEGTLALFDRKFDLAVKLVDVDATPYAPYIPEYLEAVRFESARITLDGNLAGSGKEDGTLDGAWKGKATIADVRFDDANTSSPILEVRSLGADGDLGFSLHPDGGRQVEWTGPLSLTELALAAPSATPREANVATIGIEGTAKVDRGADGVARAGWSGSVDVGATEFEATTS